MKVLKFGGSSVGTPDRIKGVKKIIDAVKGPCVVIVSAFEGVTDSLKKISELAVVRNEEYKTLLEESLIMHRSFADELAGEADKAEVLSVVDLIFSELRYTLEGVFLLRDLSRHVLDQILSTGERLSSLIIASHLEHARLIDSREVIKTDDNFGNANVDYETTAMLIRKSLDQDDRRVIMAGFIASTANDETTTLGRGGSDYTAAIVAAALNAEALEIWTDTDGFMTADPKKVEKAYAIECLSYQEAIELSHFGAKVIYTPTLRPVYRQQIPVFVRNSFKPEEKGTIISSNPENGNKSPIKGISSIDHIDLVTLQGTAMVGVAGTSMRLFGALARHNISIVLITQASSEYSITFALNPPDTKLAVTAITSEFEKEIKYSRELNVLIEKDLSIIAIVGEKMKNTPGISATLFKSLSRNGISVIATAQGSSELNISVVIRNENLGRALNVIHDGFFLSKYKEMHICIAGIGFVGSSLLKQLHKQHEILLRDHKLKVYLLGVANSRKMLVSRKGIPLATYRHNLDENGEKSDIASLIERFSGFNLRNSVFIDCTASAEVASHYGSLLSKYISVVTANKLACSSDYSYYCKLKSSAGEKNIRFMYETTVGAGLPIIKTINDLVVSGDRIIKIEAVLSGTLNFIFNTISPDIPFSKAVRTAREKGISEPDPRIDLAGTDVVRKILILSREAGYPLEKNDVEVIGFLPAECFEGSIDNFFTKIKEYDEEFEHKRQELMKSNKKWRFYATMELGKARVELVEVDSSHPSYDLDGSNNIVLLTTERYRELPMVIKGYGAGPEVTAAGVFADLMRVVNV